MSVTYPSNALKVVQSQDRNITTQEFILWVSCTDGSCNCWCEVPFYLVEQWVCCMEALMILCYHLIILGWNPTRNCYPNISAGVDGVRVAPFVVGDSAFPLEKGIMKPYINSILSSEQSYFNNRWSRARMVTDGAYRQLKAWWKSSISWYYIPCPVASGLNSLQYFYSKALKWA